MVSGDFADAKTYERVAKAIEGKHTPVFYLEIPPSLFGRVVEGLAHANLTAQRAGRGGEAVRPRPGLGPGAQRPAARVLEEWQIFRIDHFLGKEPAMDIMFLRFANSVFEPLWNRDRIQCVQITMAENFGVEDRGSFYDPVGALRDVVQNHLLQLIGLFAAEPPSAADADGLRDKRAEVFRAIPSIDPAHYVRGQYDGYRSIKGVKPDSQTETFAALRLEIDNWRWSGVPFFMRAGKALPVRATEIRVIFKRPPKLAITSTEPDPNELVLRIDPSPAPTWSSRPRSPARTAPDVSTSR